MSLMSLIFNHNQPAYKEIEDATEWSPDKNELTLAYSNKLWVIEVNVLIIEFKKFKSNSRHIFELNKIFNIIGW